MKDKPDIRKCTLCGQEIKKKKRTVSQNAALHLYFQYISDELNELGLTFSYDSIRGLTLETPYTATIVKELVWKPIQSHLFGTDSTTKLDTKQIDQIIMIFSNYFGQKGIEISFPSIETYQREYNKMQSLID